MNDFDVIVIGAGPAGYEVASLLSSGGKSVCIIEKEEKQVGGTCLNEGCVPAKNFLESAAYLKKSSYFKDCGIDMTFNSFDITKLQYQTNCLISDLKHGILTKLKKSKVSIKYGNASFVNENTIAVNDEQIQAQNIVIASGSVHRNHPLMNLHDDKIISSREMFELKEIPTSVLVVGGGAIGCEFATFLNSFNCEVDIAEFTGQLIPSEDVDVAKALKRELEKKSIGVSINTNITEYKILEDGVEVTLDFGKKTEVKKYEKILISIGRMPNSINLELENANIQSTNDFIDVNASLQSLTNKSVYAIGDVIRTPALAHTAYYEAKRVAQSILEQDVFKEHAIFPSVIFSSPQVASVGALEKDLKKEEIKYKTKKLFFKSNAKAKIKGDDGGFVKIAYDENTNVILGASIIGNDATELIHQFLIAINMNTSIDEVSKMIFAHPTLSESFLDLLA